MYLKILSLLINGLSPVIVGLFYLTERHEPTSVSPWPIVGMLLGANLLLALFAWKRTGSTPRQRETTLMRMVVNSLVPLATFYWVFPADGSLSAPMQVAIYFVAQIVWIVAVDLAPDGVGRFRQQKAEERALLGKQRFENRDEILTRKRRKGAKR